MFKFLFLNKLKILLRNRSLLFWTFIFPFVLGTFFELALSDIGSAYEDKIIPLAVVDNNYYQNETNLQNIITNLSSEDSGIFKTKYTTEEEAIELLKDKEIDGYIILNNNKKINVVVLENGIESMIIKSVIDNYYELDSVVNNIITYDSKKITEETLKLLEEDKKFIIDTTTQKINFSINYFFTLIAMTCMYGSLIALEVVKDNEANLSKKGARVSVSPVSKIKSSLAGMLASFLIEFVVVILLFGYLIFAFKVDFGQHLLETLLLSLVGCLVGVALGTFVGVSNRKSDNFKTGFLIAIIMLFSFFSGMMGSIEIKVFFDENLPLLSKINPVNTITDGLYYLFAYDNLNAYFNALIRLIILFFILSILTFIYIRRKKYDSI